MNYHCIIESKKQIAGGFTWRIGIGKDRADCTAGVVLRIADAVTRRALARLRILQDPRAAGVPRKAADPYPLLVCHAESNNAFRLERLSPGAAAWNDEQSRKNFEMAAKLVNPGDPGTQPAADAAARARGRRQYLPFRRPAVRQQGRSGLEDARGLGEREEDDQPRVGRSKGPRPRTVEDGLERTLSRRVPTPRRFSAKNAVSPRISRTDLGARGEVSAARCRKGRGPLVAHPVAGTRQLG